MALFLGIDGGGTKTAAVILKADGKELGRGLGGPGNIATGSEPALAQSLGDAVGGACRAAGLSRQETRFAAVCAGVAGYSAAERREAFRRLLGVQVQADSYRVEPDYVIAYWGATCGEPGIIVIAGTGAISYGRNARGETCREDGLGYLLGDRGSGFDLGLRALRYTLEQVEAGTPDRLAEAIMTHTGAVSHNAIVQWLYGNFSPARVAALAPVVGALAEAGDEPARRLVATMAHQLRHAARQVRHKLWLPRDSPVYLLGSLWEIGEFFRSEFADPRWLDPDGASDEPDPLNGGRFLIEPPRHDAAYGAALLARETLTP
ncbi:MAG TPA: BadF/BadG/BcrA/BcrD ATPase family protein [Chthonomonadaceae bacterium]|nr:BadF/BadG/BcrA/BcrD ATPase family protein [Chthonomonadaceae bacterium]